MGERVEDQELMNVSAIQQLLGYHSTAAARGWVRRQNIPQATDHAGRLLSDPVTGEKLYPTPVVMERHENRPRPGYKRRLWNFMQVELAAEDGLARPMTGPGGLSRDQAHSEIQGILDRTPALAEIAATWRRGAKDDTVYAGPFIWCIYEHPHGEDPRKAALEWIEGLAAVMRSAGVDAQVAKFPEHNAKRSRP